ncbi:MAG: ribonuclease H-like domain-containing protein, partial [Mycolicibacterium sp.]
MSTPNRPLPPAAEAAHRLLAEHGPLPAPDLREQLRKEGFAQPLERLQQWPDRFPHRFTVTDDGLLCVAVAYKNEPGPRNIPEPEHWYAPQTARVPLERVAVLDIETTGLNRAADFVTEIALIRLDGTQLMSVEVAVPDSHAGPDTMTLSQALDILSTGLQDVDLLIGHNLLAFDLPFLTQ